METYFKGPYFLGGLRLNSNIFCAPLAGCSDYPFRKMIHRYRPGLFFCEMVKMDALVRNDPNTFQTLAYDHTMHPTAAQLCGSKVGIAAESARILVDMGFDLIDLNCGCPVDKVTRDGSGSGLLRTPEKIGDIIAEITNAVKVPVTVKIRAGWNEETINAPAITQIAESAGAAAIFVHGRTRAQGYKGPAKRHYIQECVQAASSIEVFGNGDIVDPLSAEAMFRVSGCSGILLARGLLGRPWLIEDISRHLQKLPPKPRSGLDVYQHFLQHVEETLAYENPRKALLCVRRLSAWYIQQVGGVRAIRHQLSRLRSVEEILSLFEQCDWEDLPLAHSESSSEEKILHQ